MGVWYTCDGCGKQFLVYFDDEVDDTYSIVFNQVTDEMLHFCNDCTFTMLDSLFKDKGDS